MYIFIFDIPNYSTENLFMYYSQKREWMKNGIFVSIILLIAIF